MADIDTVIARVKKLLALSNNNPNENEASAAAAKAQQLLEEHSLSMSSLEELKSHKRNDRKSKGGLYKWQRELWEAVAKLNFCVYFSLPGTTKGQTYQHRLVGSEVNVVSTEVMADYLQSTIDRLAKEWANGRSVNVFCRDAIAYREGMTTRIAQRLNDRRWQQIWEAQKAKEEATRSGNATGNALTIINITSTEEDLNYDYLYGLEPGTTAARRAESEARFKAYRAQREKERAEAQREEEERCRLDPEYAARREREKKVEAERNAKAQAAYEEKIRRRREREANAKGDASKQRSRLSSFVDGFNKADEIGLDSQIDDERRAALGNG